MDSDRLNRWLTLGANVGVLIGLALLVVEIRQGNQLALAQIEQTRSDSLLSWRREWVTNDEIVEMVAARRAILPMSEFQPMSVAEKQAATEAFLKGLDPELRVRWTFLLQTTFWDFENVHAQYQRGLISEEYWNDRIVDAILQDAPGWKATNGGEMLRGRREFVDEVERLLQMYPSGRRQ